MLDEKIAPLVEALNELDFVTTIGSCQGHPEGIGLNGGNGYKTPNVIFQTSPQSVTRLRELIMDAKLICTWVIDEFNQDKSQYSLTARYDESFSLGKAWFDVGQLTNVIRG